MIRPIRTERWVGGWAQTLELTNDPVQDEDEREFALALIGRLARGVGIELEWLRAQIKNLEDEA